MNSLRCIFFLLTVATVALCQRDASQNGPQEILTPTLKHVVYEVNLNEAFDNSLSNIRTYLYDHGMDPMDIPDIEIPLSHLPGLLKTKMILHHGYIQQLSTIIRTGDIIMQYDENKISFYLNIGWELLDLSHEYSLRYMLFTRKGDCYGRYENVKAKMLVEYDFQIRKINLKFLKFTDVGNFNLKLEGHMIDGFVNIITKAVTKFFRENVLQMIEAKTNEEIYKKVQEINDLIPSPMDNKVIAKLVENDFEFKNSKPYKVEIQI